MTTSSARTALWVLLLATLAGCGAMPTPGGDDRYWLRPGLGRPRSEAVSLMHYFDYVRTLPPADQQDERARLGASWRDDATDFRRVQFAIVLAAPPSTPTDRQRAAELLDPIATSTEGHDAEVHLLAIVLLRELELGRRLDAAREATRELEQRLETMGELERRVQSMRELERSRAETARELERRIEAMKEMQRKLDAMKDIERKLLLRGRAQPLAAPQPQPQGARP